MSDSLGVRGISVASPMGPWLVASIADHRIQGGDQDVLLASPLVGGHPLRVLRGLIMLYGVCLTEKEATKRRSR